MPYYTRYGNIIYNPSRYAETGAPMYETPYRTSSNINEKHYIYQINTSDKKKYIGKTNNIDNKLKEYINSNIELLSYEILAECNGIDSELRELEITNKCIEKYGRDNVVTTSINNKNINEEYKPEDDFMFHFEI